jgi:hypothetical protein
MIDCNRRDSLFPVLLQVNPAASRSTLTSNFKRLHDTPPSPEYSDDTKGSREMILKLAYDNLTDVTARHAYDRQVANGEGQVTYEPVQTMHQHYKHCSISPFAAHRVHS